LATKSAGRVSIRVLPDSSRFREDLKVSLERIEKTMKATIPAELAVTRESVRRLKEQLRELEVRIKVEPYVTQEQLHDLKEKLEDIDPNIRANLDALRARQQLAVLTRARTVPIFVRVNAASVAAAAQTLAALSGARLLGNVFDSFWNSIKNLDKNAPKLGLISSGILGLSGAVLALISNFATLGVSFAQLGQIAVLLPALLTGSAISIGVLIAAFKDTKKVLADLGPAFSGLQNIISDKFWGQAAAPIRELVQTLLPTMRATLGDLARAWGNLFGEMSREIKANVTPDKLTFMMGNLTKSIDIAAKAMKPMVAAFTTLGSFGSEYLPRLSTWLVKLSDQFNNFIQAAASDGRLAIWAENGIQAFKDLGRVLRESGRVFAALGRAAQAAGGSTFAGLADGLRKLADTMNTSNFQVTFATIFGGAHKLMDGLIDGLNRLGQGLANFAPTLSTIFDTVGKILGQLLENIGLLVSDPTLQTGLKNFFSGFLTFMTDLKPAMAPLGQIIGTLASALGLLLSQMGPVLTEAAKQLAPIFVELFEAVKPLIPELTSLLRDVLKELGPVLLSFVKEVLPPLIPLIAKLAPLVVELVKAAAPAIVVFFEQLGNALKVATPFALAAVGWLTDMVKVMNDFPKAFAQLSLGDTEGGLFTIMRLAIENPQIPGFFTALNTALGGVLDRIAGAGSAIESITGFVEAIGWLTDPAKGLPSLIIAFNNLFGVVDKWSIFWATLGQAVTGFSAIPGVVGTAIALIIASINTLFPTSGSWTTFWSGLPTPASLALSMVTAAINLNIPAMVAQFLGFFANAKMQWDIFWRNVAINAAVGLRNIAAGITNGIPGMLLAVIIGMAQLWAQFAAGFQTIIGAVPAWMARVGTGLVIGVASLVATARGIPSQISGALISQTWQFFQAGGALIDAFARGIGAGIRTAVAAATTVIAAVKGLFPHSPAKYGPFSGRGYTIWSGRALVDDFGKGMAQRAEALQKTARGVVASADVFNGTSSFTSAASGVSGTYSTPKDRALVNIEGDYYGATPEKVADEFDKKARRANLVAQIGKVGK
jgi:hypothetical protein